MKTPVIEMRNIVKKFGDFVANDGINLTVHKGEIHAILGENGAGKSTLMNQLYGLLKPTSGDILVNGKKIVMNNPRDAIDAGIGVAVQGSFDDGDVTIFKCEGDLSRFHAQEGTIQNMPWSDMLCRTQIKVKLRDFDYFLTDPINNHHVICRGRHADDAAAFFRLLG